MVDQSVFVMTSAPMSSLSEESINIKSYVLWLVPVSILTNKIFLGFLVWKMRGVWKVTLLAIVHHLFNYWGLRSVKLLIPNPLFVVNILSVSFDPNSIIGI